MKSKLIIFIIFTLFVNNSKCISGEKIYLDFNNSVEIALQNSYRIKNLEMGIKKTLLRLDARKAGLKSKVYLNLDTPELNRLSESKWNSTLYQDEIVKTNNEMWQSELSIKQPVMVFGYTTNGYMSLNYKLYRYRQKDNGNKNIDYYNRFYFKYEQPLFLPNELKNDLERAELDLTDSKLNYITDKVNIIRDIGYDYYDLWELVYEDIILNNQILLLDDILTKTNELLETDASWSLNIIQLELELTNEKENLLENKSRLRMESSNLKQRLRLNNEDSLIITPKIEIKPITIELDQAIELGLNNSLWLRQIKNYKRHSELDVEDQKGRNAFHVNLELTYGLEKKDTSFEYIWDDYDNSNSATINAYIPLWDWGERKKLIQSELVDVERRLLDMEEARENIKKNIINSYTNMKEYQVRFVNLQESRVKSESFLIASMKNYYNNNISIQDLLQIVQRHKETEFKFLDTYLGFKRSVLSLMINTYFDFENSISLIDQEFGNFE